jgi:hypothetical protein
MRRTVLLSAAVCALAVGVRLHTLRQIPPAAWGGTENERVAAALARGQGWSDAFGAGTGPTAHLAPAYPLLLSGVYRLFGTYETTSGRLAQQYLSLGMATLVLLLLPATARKLGLSVTAGWAAAFLTAVLPANLWAEVTGHHEQGAAALILLGLVGALADLRQSAWSSRRAVLFAGALLGLIVVLCPNLLLVPVLFLLSEWVRRPAERRRIVRRALVLSAFCLAFMAPWVVRNYVVLGGLVPLRSNLGLELAVGNRPGADGHTYAAGFNAMHPFGSAAERARLVRLGELEYMRQKQRQALAWIADNPAEFARLTLRRAELFWFTPDERWRSPDLRLRLGARVYGVIGLAVLLELLRLLRRGHPAGWLLVCTVVGAGVPYFVTHVEMRYRMPIVGLFALLSCNLAVTTIYRFAFALRARNDKTAPAETRRAA